MISDEFYYGALPAPRLQRTVPGEPASLAAVSGVVPAVLCPWCYRAAGVPFPLDESSTICDRHKRELLDTLDERRAARAAAGTEE